MKVFRFEDSSGIGPYRSNISSPDIKFDSFRHPLPYEDSKLSSKTEEYGIDLKYGTLPEFLRFGFSSLDQLRNWFYSNNMLIELHRAGFVLKIYESNAVYEGWSQCLFDKRPEKSTCIAEENILEYFQLNK